jgi:hypothetical protein
MFNNLDSQSHNMELYSGIYYYVADGGVVIPPDPTGPTDPTEPTLDIMKVKMRVSNVTAPAYPMAKLKYDKDVVMCFRFDDVLKNQYFVAFPILSEYTYTDGTNSGKQMMYRGTLAIIPPAVAENNDNPGHAGYSWANVQEMCNRAVPNKHNYWGTISHSQYHGGDHDNTPSGRKWDNLQDLKQAEVMLYTRTGLRPIMLATPASNLGMLYTAKNLGYLKVSTSTNEGNGAITDYAGSNATSINALTKNSFQVMDIEAITDGFGSTEVAYFKTKIDKITAKLNAGERHLYQTHITHGPGDPAGFRDVFDYIQSQLGDRLWFATFQELVEYHYMSNYVNITHSLSGNELTITIDQTNVPPNFRDRGLSLLTTGFNIEEVLSFEGLDDVTVNPSTGLLNTFKINTDKIIDPSTDVLPAQIISVTAAGNKVNILYDKPVTQTLFGAYTINGNTSTGISGSGVTWSVTFANTVSPGQEMRYRQYNGTGELHGNAATVGTGLLVCDYVQAEGGGIPII